jgi:hypothetical protein
MSWRRAQLGIYMLLCGYSHVIYALLCNNLNIGNSEGICHGNNFATEA